LDTNGNVLYISSLSKIVASGLRIGWINGPPQVIQRLADAKQQVDFGHSVFPQWVANQFLGSEHFTTHIEMIRSQLKLRKDVMTSSLKEFTSNQVDFFSPEGGIHLWCRVSPSINEYQLLEESMKNGVAFVPGSIFGSKKGYIRFTFGRGEPNDISKGISRFAEALRSLR
jgi:GntR family transcriptional regulator of abcA and norABC